MPPAVYRDMQWIKSDKYEEIMNGGFATNTYVNYMVMQANMTVMKHVIINETVESCMSIYLVMAMEIP